MTEIVSTEDVLGGAPRFEGRRIGVHHVVSRVIDAGEDPAQVAADYDIDVADIYRALAYYYDHVEEIRETTGDVRVSEDYRIVEEPADLPGVEERESEA